MNILFVASEAAPFVKTGGLADVAGSLPAEFAARGHDVRVVLPLYDEISSVRKEELTFMTYTYVFLAWRRQYCGIFRLEQNGITYYFIDNEYYFKRGTIYGHYDDGERFGFFSKAAVQILPLINWHPDIIHCNDWQTALVPVYLRREASGFFSDIKTVFTIHNIEYQGQFGRETMWELFGLPMQLYDSGIIEYNGGVNLLKAAMYISNYVTTVSPTYAEELKRPDCAFGLHQVVQDNSHKLKGILNGLDTKLWNPATDVHLCQHYSAQDTSGKVYNKLELQRALGLNVDESIPVIGCVSRLVAPKGFDLILQVLGKLMEENVQLILLGTGDWEYEQSFKTAQSRFAGRLSANIMYSDTLASQIYAGADMFLMPSRSEPCGLSQMISMRYGTVPVIRATGGLRDSVIPHPTVGSTGFSFERYDARDMLSAVKSALSYYRDKTAWSAIMKRGMTSDFTWTKSAGEYLDIFQKLL